MSLQSRQHYYALLAQSGQLGRHRQPGDWPGCAFRKQRCGGNRESWRRAHCGRHRPCRTGARGPSTACCPSPGRPPPKPMATYSHAQDAGCGNEGEGASFGLRLRFRSPQWPMPPKSTPPLLPPKGISRQRRSRRGVPGKSATLLRGGRGGRAGPRPGQGPRQRQRACWGPDLGADAPAGPDQPRRGCGTRRDGSCERIEMHRLRSVYLWEKLTAGFSWNSVDFS